MDDHPADIEEKIDALQAQWDREREQIVQLLADKDEMSEEIEQRKEVLERRVFFIKDLALLKSLTECAKERATLMTEFASSIEAAGRLWEHLETTLGERENPIEFVTTAEEIVASMRKVRNDLEQHRANMAKQIDRLNELFNQSREKVQARLA